MAEYNNAETKTSTTEESLGSQADKPSPAPSTKDEGHSQDPDWTGPQESAIQFDTSDYPSGIPLFLITSALVIVLFASNLDTTIITTAIPRITDEFNSVDE